MILNNVNTHKGKMASRVSTDGSHTVNRGTSIFMTFGVVVFGCALVKRDWVPYALLLLAMGYGGSLVFSGGMSTGARS